MLGARFRMVVAAGWLLGGGLAATGGTARAQDPGLGGILGGYGAMADSPGASMGGGPAGMGGSLVVPAAGRLSAPISMPAGMGGGLSFRPAASAPMSSGRTPFTLGAAGGMSRMGGDMGGRRPFALTGGRGSGALGIGSGMPRMLPPGSMGVMPPSIGYPFRQPPSLLTPPAAGAGMSM